MSYEKDVILLEEKYADRGLKFTSAFEGFAPIQAYGHLDGKRFYFRLRGGDASLRVGVYDLAVEIAEKKLRNERLGYKAGNSVYRIQKESDPELYPTVILLQSGMNSGKMRMTELFSALVEALEPAEA